MCQSVISGSSALFRDKNNFSKTRIDPVMLKFLVTTELKIQNKSYQKIRVRIAGKSRKITRAKLLFAILPESPLRVELSCS